MAKLRTIKKCCTKLHEMLKEIHFMTVILANICTVFDTNTYIIPNWTPDCRSIINNISIVKQQKLNKPFVVFQKDQD